MQFQPLEIPEVILIKPRVYEDARGFFYEGYKKTVFEANGIKDHFVQDNFSCSAKGVVRGFHYQVSPRAQAKLVTVMRGAVLDVALDIRRKSKTFGKAVSCVLSAEKREMLYVPAGFAHAFYCLEDHTEFMYKVSDLYSPEHERGILWSDPDIQVKWPSAEGILSDKDKKNLRLRDAEVFEG